MRYIEKHPMIMIVIGILGISLSSILVKYSTAPSAVTAAFRLLWTVLFLTPVVLGKSAVRKEFKEVPRKLALLSCLSGLFLAIHFVLWFESLRHTSVASSTTIVCTEVIWVCLGFCLFMKGKLSPKAILAIAVTLGGSVLIAYSDSGSGSQQRQNVSVQPAAAGVGPGDQYAAGQGYGNGDHSLPTEPSAQKQAEAQADPDHLGADDGGGAGHGGVVQGFKPQHKVDGKKQTAEAAEKNQLPGQLRKFFPHGRLSQHHGR